MNEKIIYSTLSIIIGFLIGYLSAYIKEKGKNKALIEDLEKITEEKEKVTSKYELDISKRKYKYEDKREQYFKYFNLLDELNTDGNKKTQEEFIPAMNKFNKEFMMANGNKKKELTVTSDFSSTLNNLMFKANESLIKLQNETNTIKLIAGDKVLNILVELENAYKTAMDISGIMMKGLAANVVYGNQDILNKQKEDSENIGKFILAIKEKLIQEVKNELDEI